MKNFGRAADYGSISHGFTDGAADGDGERRKEKILKQIWQWYDESDWIYEERHDTASAHSNRGEKSGNAGRSRIARLKKLLTKCREYSGYREHADVYISANITMGNIYLRISHCNLDMFEYEMARICAGKAREHLWNALQEYQLRYRSTINIYKLLIHLDLAKYYREWAALTRRSNYELAIRQLQIVLDELGEIYEELEGSTAWKGRKRQLALLYVDVMVNKGKILRLDYFLERSDAYLRGLAWSLLPVTGDMEDKFRAILAYEQGMPEMEPEQTELAKYLKYLNGDDKKDYLLSALIQLSLVWIKQRKYDKAEQLTEQVNAYEKNNHDAKNHRGFCYRKMGELEQAAREFLDVVEMGGKQEGRPLKDLELFVKDEAKRYGRKEDLAAEDGAKRCGGKDEPVLQNRDSGLSAKQINRFAYINLLKCVLDLYIKGELSSIVFSNALQIIDGHLACSPSDYEISLLKSRYLMQADRLDEAMELLEHMMGISELSYVRRGTIGLKIRYLFSECYLRKDQYSKAENLLISIRKELHKDGTGKMENQLDPQVENNIGWCLINQGRSREALKCYMGLVDSIWNPQGLRNEGSAEVSIIDKLKDIFEPSMERFFDRAGTEARHSQEDEKEIRWWKSKSAIQISCLNNMGECFLRADTEHANAKKIFDLIIQIEPDNGIAYLHRGYCEEKTEEKAKWFKKAFRYAPYKIEVRSCYLINMVEMYLQRMGHAGAADEAEQLSREIRDFIHYMPYSYSINMCLALLRWKSVADPEYFLDSDWGKIDASDNSPDTQTKHIQDSWEDFGKAFSRIEFFPELGTRAFEKLKGKSGFCHLKAVERGRIITHLLYLYEPIIKIRKSCHFQYDDWRDLVDQQLVDAGTQKPDGEYSRKPGRNRSGLVHYTRLDTLKKLLDQSGTPHLRVSNSGYMNDSSEGEIFFEEMRYVIRDDACKEDSGGMASVLAGEIDAMIQCYFHELQGDPDRVLPRGGNVYITSLSTQADSFPMWDIYAGKEQGCNIEFDENFFDLKGSSWGTLAGGKEGGELDYSISTYTDDNYPLYAVQYVYRDHYAKQGENPKPAGFCSRDGKSETGSCRMEYHFFENCLREIACRWNVLHKLLGGLKEHYAKQERPEETGVGSKTAEDAVNEIRAFVADRINEVRYLFKDRDYNFEGEVRLVRVVEVDDTRAQTDSREIPRAFTEVDREIEDIVVTLASKLNDEQVNEVTTWLKHTGRVRDVRLATRNRLRRSVAQQAKTDS